MSVTIPHYSFPWAVDQKKARLQESNGSMKSTQNDNGGKVTEYSSHQHNTYYYVQKVLSINSLSCKLLKRNPEKGTGRREEQTPSNTKPFKSAKKTLHTVATSKSLHSTIGCFPSGAHCCTHEFIRWGTIGLSSPMATSRVNSC